METKGIGFLFDLDGVLIDSESEYTRIWSEIDARFKSGVEDFAYKIKGMTLPEILNDYYPVEDHEAIVEMLNEREQKMKYEWLPGAHELLEILKKKDLPCVLVTSSNNLKLKHLREERPELPSYFKEIVSADKVSRSKPDPEGYLLGASLLGVEPKRCVVFEDSKQGVKAGRSSGAYTVGLTTTLPKEIIEEYCDMTIRDLAEIDIEKLAKILYKR